MWPSGEFRSIPSQCYRVLTNCSSFRSSIAGQFDDLTQNEKHHVIDSERNRCRVIEQTNNSISTFYTHFVVDSNGKTNRAIDSVIVHWLSLQNSRRVVAILSAVILCMFCVQHLSSSISPNEWCNHLSNKCSCNRNVLARYIAHRPMDSLFNLLSNGPSVPIAATQSNGECTQIRLRRESEHDIFIAALLRLVLKRQELHSIGNANFDNFVIRFGLRMQ